jgi:hypothetical protein
MTAHESGEAPPRPYIGTSYLERPKNVISSEGDVAGSPPNYEYDRDAGNVEDAYADHLVDRGNGEQPPPLPKPAQKDLLAANPINPDSAQNNVFIDLEAYVDPGSGKPRPTSPIERLRLDMERLRGGGEDQSLKILLELSSLDQRDFGIWQAADDLRTTAATAHTTIGSAVQRLWTVYAAVIQALDDHVKTVKGADLSIASDMRTQT